MTHNRRDFIRYSSLAGASLLVPAFLKAGAMNRRKLVLVQLSGGNDGWNTIVPYRHDLYYKSRPTLALQLNELIWLNDEVAFNKNLEGIASLYENGDVTVINNVGYSNQGKSHFRCRNAWQSGFVSDKSSGTGWIGKMMDADHSMRAVEMDNSLSLVLRGETRSGLVYSTEALPRRGSVTGYPDHEFASRLREVAGMINSDEDFTVFHVTLPGFDTHVSQKNIHNQLLRIFGDTMKSFSDDLKSSGKWKDTLVLTYSEFGRSIFENENGGTHHGTGSTVFLMSGNPGQAGLFNEFSPDENYNVDFRNIYGTILNKWLHTGCISGNQFELLNIV